MPKKYDQPVKTLAEGDPRGLLDLLGRLPLSVEADVTPLERELTRDPLLIDHGYIVRRGAKRWVEHIEAYSRFPADAPQTLATYAGELVFKTNLPVYTTVLLMVEAYNPGKIPSVGRIRKGAFRASQRFQVIRLWEVEAAELLAKGRPHLLWLVPLAHASPPEWVETSRRIKQIEDDQLRSKVEATFRAMGGLRYGKEEWQKMLSRGENMIFDRVLRESWVVQEWMQEGLEKGLEQGMEKGIEKGIEKGLAKGRVLELHRAIDRVLAARFPSLSPPTKRLNAVQDIKTLDKLFAGLLTAPDIVVARRLLAIASSKKL